MALTTMGHRLTKISTRTGDNGTTGLSDGRRVKKDHPRIEAIGDIDELNSAIGIVLTNRCADDVRKCLTNIQQQLFNIGAEFSMCGKDVLTAHDIDELDQHLASFNNTLPPLKEFILPGGNPASAACHLARTICRRAERSIINLTGHETVNQHTISYVNRLSDLLFVIARVLSRATKADEPQWKTLTPP